MAKFYYSTTKQKVLLLLVAGLALGLSRSPRHQWRILTGLPKALKDTDRAVLNRILHEFHRERLVDFRIEKDGITQLVLTELGRKRALRYKIDEITISIPLRWDGKWRIVLFDIPERQKKAREALRSKLRELGFVQFQKSAWVLPYPCKNEIDFIVEVFEIRPHVQYLEVARMTNDAKLKLHFNLS